MLMTIWRRCAADEYDSNECEKQKTALQMQIIWECAAKTVHIHRQTDIMKQRSKQQTNFVIDTAYAVEYVRVCLWF